MKGLDLSYMTEMSDEELFEEIGDAEYFNYHSESINQLDVIMAGEKELIKRGFKSHDNVELQFVPLTTQILNRL